MEDGKTGMGGRRKEGGVGRQKKGNRYTGAMEQGRNDEIGKKENKKKRRRREGWEIRR